jgi:hypothetical protein
MTLPLFAITPVPPGHTAPEEAIIVGPYNEVLTYIPQSVARQDAIEELEKARFTADQIASMQQKTRAVQVSMLTDSVNHLCARLDSLLTRRDEQRRLDAEREEEEEQQRIQAELDALPDPDAPDPLGHQNTADLHALPHKVEGDQSEFELPNKDPTGEVIPQPAALEFDGD